MNLAAQATASYFDAQGIKYKLDGEEKEAILTGFPTKIKSGVKVLCLFSSDNHSVRICIYDYCNAKENEKPQFYELCSKMNAKYSWAKFYLNENNNTVTLETDAFIQLDSCGEEVLAILQQLVAIADDAWLEFVKISMPDFVTPDLENLLRY